MEAINDENDVSKNEKSEYSSELEINSKCNFQKAEYRKDSESSNEYYQEEYISDREKANLKTNKYI